MKLKICTLLIAAFVTIAAMFAISCERVSVSDAKVSVSQTQKNDLRSNKQSVSHQTVTAVTHADTALLSNRIVKESAMPASGTISRICYEEEYPEEEYGYQYAYLRLRPKPPRFSGLGGDHFARADV